MNANHRGPESSLSGYNRFGPGRRTALPSSRFGLLLRNKAQVLSLSGGPRPEAMQPDRDRSVIIVMVVTSPA